MPPSPYIALLPLRLVLDLPALHVEVRNAADRMLPATQPQMNVADGVDDLVGEDDAGVDVHDVGRGGHLARPIEHFAHEVPPPLAVLGERGRNGAEIEREAYRLQVIVVGCTQRQRWRGR